MTNSQPLDNTNARLDDLDTRLEQLGDEIDLIRTIQTANRRELRFNSQSLARVERTIIEIGDIVRLQSIQAERDRQQAERDRQVLNQLIAEAAQDRQQVAIDRQVWQTEIRRIWEHLQGRNGGSSISQ